MLHLARICLAFLAITFALVAHAEEVDLAPLVAKFAEVKKFSHTRKVIKELAETGNAAVVPVLQALADGQLWILKKDRSIVIAKGKDGNYSLSTPLDQKPLGEAVKSDLKKIKIKNSIRRQIAKTISSLTLRASDPSVRQKAASGILLAPDAAAIEGLDEAIAAEQLDDIKTLLIGARAASILVSDQPAADKKSAIDVLSNMATRNAATVLSKFVETEKNEDLKSYAQAGLAKIQEQLAWWDILQNVWYGLSLGSVLLLAAIGLAITFGVMGVINMAHGEMVMLGAYTTFVVQEFIRNSAPGLFEYSLLFALPLAFLVAGSVGFALERGVIRFLYGRPLETLLATWGVSLMLQQGIRTIFGPTNKEVGNPEWMSGTYELGGLALTANRVWILLFSLAVFAGLLFLLKKSRFGLQMRAVTQNRAMASSMGIRTPWVDAFTFALGSGVAGIAGVALSQISNVSPNLGQGYIIDSFMVVVFGGVGNLWGTLVAAMSLGITNKFLEPFAGAVLAKILILVFIILFIQKKPRGLFALKGRAVET